MKGRIPDYLTVTESNASQPGSSPQGGASGYHSVITRQVFMYVHVVIQPIHFVCDIFAAGLICLRVNVVVNNE